MPKKATKEEETGELDVARGPHKTRLIPTKELVQTLIEKSVKVGAEELFDTLMLFSYVQKASDIHLEPWSEEQASVRLRKDGMLSDEFKISHALNDQLISRLKILTKMRTDEHSVPQDGRFKFFAAEGEGVDVRASVIPSSEGEKAVLRLLSGSSHKLSLEQLGFSEADLKKMQRAIHRSWGMILSTGPTGSGKTTTIYGILEVLNIRSVNISTIEDPVEFELPGITQSQVNEAKKFTFASGLRSLLRQDPDIIMVGEIRDQETAKIAVNAAMTGHKLLSTLHTNDAATTIPRLLDLGAEPFLVASTLILAIAQRLVRKPCEKCKTSQTLSRKDAEGMVNPELLDVLFDGKKSITVVKTKAEGCKECGGSGYHGRIGIFELLENTPAIQELINKRASRAEIHNQAIKDGMTTLTQDASRKVLDGKTTIEEVVRVLQED